MRLVPTRRTDYGIRALVCLALHEGDWVKAGAIADEMDIPQGFLHQVLRDLQRHRWIRSRAGRRGGYMLAIDAQQVTVLAVIEALEGPMEIVECVLRGGPCHWKDVCAVHAVWSAGSNAFRSTLEKATIADLVTADRELAAGTFDIPTDSHRGN